MELTRSKRLPVSGYSRLPTVLSIFPISRSRWYAAIQTGHIERPVKIGERTAAWSNEYLNSRTHGLGGHPLPHGTLQRGIDVHNS